MPLNEEQHNHSPSTADLLRLLKDEFHSQQTTPLQDKKLTVPVALAAIIIGTLVAATWKVSSLYESAINSRIQTGIRERAFLRKEIVLIRKATLLHDKQFKSLKSSVNGNTEDLDDLWKLEADKKKKQNEK